MGVLRAIKHQHFGQLERRKWEYTYWAFDLHGTILMPNYEAGNVPTKFYPYSKEVLQMLSKREDIVMFMYTCSHPHEQDQYVKFFTDLGIDFKWVNENQEVLTDNNGYGYYEDKPYFNVLLEDKAGFDPMEDWEDIRDYFRATNSTFPKLSHFFFKIKRLFKNGI